MTLAAAPQPGRGGLSSGGAVIHTSVRRVSYLRWVPRAINAVGAAVTALLMVIVISTKFTHGPWLLMIAFPCSSRWPLEREGQVGSGDTLVRTIRMVAAALSAMATAKHPASNPRRDRGAARDAGRALARGMDVLDQAAEDVPLHRSIGQVMAMNA